MKALLAFLCISSSALADAPAAPTSAMIVIGWEAETHRIIYVNALPFADRAECKAALTAMTPASDNKVAFTSVCLSPTDETT